MKKVDVYAKTQDGKWVLIFKDIDEKQATDIWMAGLRTGENRISIDDEMSRRVAEINRKQLGIK